MGEFTIVPEVMPPPKKSQLWNHFTLVNDDFRIASCNYCGNVARNLTKPKYEFGLKFV